MFQLQFQNMEEPRRLLKSSVQSTVTKEKVMVEKVFDKFFRISELPKLRRRTTKKGGNGTKIERLILELRVKSQNSMLLATYLTKEKKV